MKINIDTSKLVTAADKLVQAKEAKIAELSKICADKITSGFYCNALGEPHLYPAKPTDQANLNSSVTASLLITEVERSQWYTPFWCMDAEGKWEFREHSCVQIQAVGVTGKAAILALMRLNSDLAEMVLGCTTLEQVEQVQWPQANDTN